MADDQNQQERVSESDFVKRAIKSLRKDPFKGIHSVYSGFNEAFREYFNDDPIKWTTQLASEGIIETQPVRRGVMLYLPGEAPERSGGKNTLKKMGL
jgi:hypothetical protein